MKLEKEEKVEIPKIKEKAEEKPIIEEKIEIIQKVAKVEPKVIKVEPKDKKVEKYDKIEILNSSDQNLNPQKTPESREK